MPDPLDLPLHRPAINNPRLLSREELIGGFVVRAPMLERILEAIRRESPGKPPQHHLILGQRGMGKTTFLLRLRYAIEEDSALREKWLPLVFPEEQYNVARLSDLWLNCIDALGDALESRGDSHAAEALSEGVQNLLSLPEDELAPAALALLLAQVKGRGLVLLLDNLDPLFERLTAYHWTIRDILSTQPGLLLIGSSARPIEETFRYEAAFYDFLRLHELRRLSEPEMTRLLLHLSEQNRTPHVARLVEEHPERIKPLQILCGGSPRTITLLHSVLSLGRPGDVRSDLEALLDLCTPLYKARLEALAPQAQQVMDGLATQWDPIGSGELAARLRLDNRAVATQLDRLCQQGLAERVSYRDPRNPGKKKKNSGYQVADRLFNLWHLARRGGRSRRRLAQLAEFLALACSPPPSPMLLSDSAADPTQLPAQSLADALERCREFARHGRAREAAALLDEAGVGERWRPLREALIAVAVGDRGALLACAPEIRQAAEAVLETLAPDLPTL